MNVRDQMKVQEQAREFWAGLSFSDKGALGDALVLGDLDWRDWLDSKPPAGFWNCVDNERISWEMQQG